jgi:hypothetical protein
MFVGKQFFGTRTFQPVWAGSVLLAALALGAAGSGALAQDGGVQATWQRHRSTFDYLGISPTYSCEGLQEGLTFLLDQSGAQLNRPISAYPCNGGGAPTRLISANLDFSTLKPVQGGDQSAGGTVEGSWRHVDLSMTRSAPQLHGSDCELVQEFKDKLLPMFTTRNVTSNLRCVPHQTFGNQFDLSFDVLTTPGAGKHHAGGAD